MNPRYSIIPAGAVTDPNIEPRDLQALCLLGRHIDDLGWCRRSQVKMAREIGCARSTIQGSIDRLIAAGWLEKRPEESKGGGDTAHSYRVILDPNGEEPFYRNRPNPGRGKKVDGSNGQSHNPADISAPPPPADLSAPPPLPIQERHPLPIYASAPLTSPVEREDEREGDAGSGQEDVSTSRLNLRPAGIEEREAAFQRLVAVYPAAAIDDEARARREWGDVAEAEWQDAVEAVPRFLRSRKDIRRSTIVSLEKYIRDAHWRRFPQPAKAGPEAEPSVELKPYVSELYALFWRAVAASRTRDAEYFLGRIDKGLAPPVSAVPPPEEVQALLPVTIGSDAHARWVTWGERMGIRLPKPDHVPVIMVPEFEPPSLSVRWKGYRLAIPQHMGIRSKTWWWRLFQDGAPISDLLKEGRKSEGNLLVEFGPWPASGDTDGMIEIKRGSLQWEAWEMWFWKVGADMRLWHESAIWCPSEYPSVEARGVAAGATA